MTFLFFVGSFLVSVLLSVHLKRSVSPVCVFLSEFFIPIQPAPFQMDFANLNPYIYVQLWHIGTVKRPLESVSICMDIVNTRFGGHSFSIFQEQLCMWAFLEKYWNNI